jgi:hypothetical protein
MSKRQKLEEKYMELNGYIAGRITHLCQCDECVESYKNGVLYIVDGEMKGEQVSWEDISTWYEDIPMDRWPRFYIADPNDKKDIPNFLKSVYELENFWKIYQ